MDSHCPLVHSQITASSENLCIDVKIWSLIVAFQIRSNSFVRMKLCMKEYKIHKKSIARSVTEQCRNSVISMCKSGS